ncbi:hypothetical protein Tco_1524435, partial [Tanacetum coccineum]
LKEEKARRRAIVFNDTLTFEALLCEPTVSSLNNDEIDFRISFDESDDEDCTVIFDKNSFSYKIVSVNNLKIDLENDNDKVNIPLLPSPKPTISYFVDLDFFKDFKNEFPAIVYNNAQTFKSDLLTEPILNPQHIDEFNLKEETSLSEYDEEEQNVICFNDLFPFNVIYPDESKTNTDNDNDKVDIEHSSEDLSIKPLPDTVYTAYPNPMDMAYRLSGRYPVFIFITVDTAYSLNEYSVFDTGTAIRRIQDLFYTKLLEDIKRGPYFKKAQYALSHIGGYGVSNRLSVLGDLDNSTSNVLIPLDSWTSGLLVYRLPLSGTKSRLRPYHFNYPKRSLTTEEMLNKFIDKGKREHEEMRAFIYDFQTKNKLLFKERNNSLIELRFGVQQLLKVINNVLMADYDVKGVTTRGGKTTTQDVHDNDTNVLPKEPAAVNPEKPVRSNEVLTNDQPQTTSEPVENLKQLHINLPFIEALDQMPKYAKFLKGLLTNKARLEEACKIIMNERSSAVLLNKLPSKEKDPGSFTIPCDIGQLHIDNALADLGASISLMPYTMYKKLGLGEPKATRMNFVILDMPEDSRVPIILGRPFLATARAMIDVFNKKITLRVRDDEVVFDVDQSIKRPTTEDDECYGIDEPNSSDEKNGSDLENSIRCINSINMSYLVTQGTTNVNDVKSEHLYSASANEIDEKKPELKNLPQHLEYAYLNGNKSFPIIISFELFEKDKILLLQVLERRKGAIAWKMSDIKGISPSYCTHKILMKDDNKPIIQPQRRLNPKVQDVVKNEIVKLLDSGLIYPISDSSWVLIPILDRFLSLSKIPPPKDTKTPVESPIPISPSSSVGSSSPVRSTTPPPDYPFDAVHTIAELDNSLWIIPRPLGSELVPEESN